MLVAVVTLNSVLSFPVLSALPSALVVSILRIAIADFVTALPLLDVPCITRLFAPPAGSSA